MQITLEIDNVIAELLRTLDDNGSIKEAIHTLIDHAAQGVYRPGAWERPWICQAFGDDFLARLEPSEAFWADWRNSQLLSKTRLERKSVA